mmetsp:Transcript_19315/g.35866  ORF Transcript_19315/g.35866 Transcript_19315/m.35866 type:complete len:270 (-) Transcript_19315:2974-3783(-)
MYWTKMGVLLLKMYSYLSSSVMPRLRNSISFWFLSLISSYLSLILPLTHIKNAPTSRTDIVAKTTMFCSTICQLRALAPLHVLKNWPTIPVNNPAKSMFSVEPTSLLCWSSYMVFSLLLVLLLASPPLNLPKTSQLQVTLSLELLMTTQLLEFQLVSVPVLIPHDGALESGQVIVVFPLIPEQTGKLDELPGHVMDLYSSHSQSTKFSPPTPRTTPFSPSSPDAPPPPPSVFCKTTITELSVIRFLLWAPFSPACHQLVALRRELPATL